MNADFERPWRAGRKLGRTLYVQLFDKPSDDDVFIGIMDNRLLAQHVVKAHNASLSGAES